jgi:hypothetical protein
MSRKKKMSLSKDVDDKDFFKYQRDFYKSIKTFIDRGNVLQKTAKDKGAIAPTEVLLFLLFWSVMKAKFDEGQLDFVSMMFEKIMFDDWMKGQMVDPPKSMEVEVKRDDKYKIKMPWDKKKETIH